jgi:hypothetical protein
MNSPPSSRASVYASWARASAGERATPGAESRVTASLSTVRASSSAPIEVEDLPNLDQGLTEQPRR